MSVVLERARGADGRGGVEACADADLEVGGLA